MQNEISHTKESLFPLTQELLETIDRLDYDALLNFVHSNYQMIDVDNECNTVLLSNIKDWSTNLLHNINALKKRGGKLHSVITDYREELTSLIGYSILDFRQEVTIEGHRTISDYVATIIWRKIGEEWKETHWHCSLKGKRTETDISENPEAHI